MSTCSLKRKCVFVVGFITGFVLAIFIFSVDDKHEDYRMCKHRYAWFCNDGRHMAVQKRIRLKPDKIIIGENADFLTWMKDNGWKVQENVTYKAWLETQNIRVSKINMDYQQYGPENDKNTAKTIMTESNWLKSKIHITCVVFIEKIKRAKSIQDSWGTSCNRLYFFSERVNDTYLSVMTFPMKLTSSWQMLCESMNYIWKYSIESNGTNDENRLEWVIFVKDDTMVIPENLRYLVAPLDFNEGHYLGHPVVLWGQAYNVAQAGFVLSKFAFRKIIENFDTHQKCTSGGRYWKKEDYYLGKHLALLGIHPADTRDRRLRGVFHGYSLQILLWGIARPGSYFTRALYPPGHECCSPKSITFSTSEPDKMYTMNYMLYHLHVYSRPGIYGSLSAPTPVPEQEVWRLALREEFNITDFNHVDSDRYYEIWSSRYSGPEQLIRKNTRTSSNARRFLPFDYTTKSTILN